MLSSSENFEAPHVLLVLVEDSDLAEFPSGVVVTCSQLSMLVVTPAKQVGILVDDVTKVVTQGEERKVGVFRESVVELFENKCLTFSPDENLVALGENRILLVVCADLFDLGDVFNLLEEFFAVAHVDLSIYRQGDCK